MAVHPRYLQPGFKSASEKCGTTTKDRGVDPAIRPKHPCATDCCTIEELEETVSITAYLTLEEVVERYRNKVSDGTLRNWRSKRIGPSFIKVGKAILYPLEELERWDRSNLISCRRVPIASSGMNDTEGEAD